MSPSLSVVIICYQAIGFMTIEYVFRGITEELANSLNNITSLHKNEGFVCLALATLITERLLGETHLLKICAIVSMMGRLTEILVHDGSWSMHHCLHQVLCSIKLPLNRLYYGNEEDETLWYGNILFKMRPLTQEAHDHQFPLFSWKKRGPVLLKVGYASIKR
jgi:hypothetical protein